MTITDYERLLWVLAEEIEESIASCYRKASDEDEWVDSAEEALHIKGVRALYLRIAIFDNVHNWPAIISAYETPLLSTTLKNCRKRFFYL